jgi:hypothetical protein
MISLTEAYRSRLLSHEELISKIQANDTLAFGSWMGQPHGFYAVPAEGRAQS